MMRQSAIAKDNQGEDSPLRWGAVLRTLREAAGVTQEGWAARLGYGRRTIQRWERDQGAPDEVATEAVVRLCGELRLFRLYYAGALAGLTVTADLVRGLAAETRLRDRSQPVRKPETRATADEPSLGPGTAATRVPAPSHNLPAELTSFVGRERELAGVAGVLGGARLVTLTGTGGVGKTRLALRVAAALLDDFTDGAWLAELAALTEPALVTQAVARAVGAREQPGRALEDTLMGNLGPRRLLIVLDNCEHLVSACAVLVARLLRACPLLHFLATSREPLGVSGEVIWQVSPLAIPTEDEESSSSTVAGAESVRLFAARASNVLPVFALTGQNTTAVAQICRRLDGIPLAIELAAARVRVLTPIEIAARLHDRFRLLVGTGRDVPPRQQTLRAAIDWSYDLLDEAERHLFDRLSVFADSFDLAAAEAVCAEDRDTAAAVLDLLARLVDRSLVLGDVSGAGGATRYRLLETLRAYGGERLDARGETEQVRRRHAAWIVGLAEEAGRAFHGPEQGRWLRRAEDAHADVRAALVWALGLDEADTALRLCAALWWCWGVHERPGEGRAWLERVLALPSAVAPTSVRARALAGLAISALFQGDASAARDFIDEADAIGQALEDDGALLAAQGSRALLLQIVGEFEAATRAADEALALARRLGEAWWEGRALEHLAVSAVRHGDLAMATTLLEEGVQLARRAGDAWGLAMTLAELGDVARARGAPAEAGARYAESLALREELGIPAATPSLRHNLGYVALAAGDVATAAKHFAGALSQFRRQGERRGIAECLIGLGAVAAAGDQAEVAARLFGAGEAALEAFGGALWPSNRADYERAVGLARNALDAESFASAWGEGRALPPEEAMNLALGRAAIPARPGG